MTDPSEPIAERRADVDAKQQWVATLLQEVGCEGLLVRDPANFAWLTAGAVAHGVLSPDEQPALYYSAEQRWLIGSSLDTQRLFDEEIDGLGFQLKEWPWERGPNRLLSEIGPGRRQACDFPGTERTDVSDRLRAQRRALSAYEQGRYRELGRLVAHALEATGRNFDIGEAEADVAGQLAHRLWRHGVTPVAITVSADDRALRYVRHGSGPAIVRRTCGLEATACMEGLYLTAGRTVSFGVPEDRFRREFEAACCLSVAYLAHARPGVSPAEVLATAHALIEPRIDDPEWRPGLPGCVTGRSAVELPLTPAASEPLRIGWALAWQARVGAAASSDTFLLADGPQCVTPCEAWPFKRIRLHDHWFDRPDVLVRELPDGSEG